MTDSFARLPTNFIASPRPPPSTPASPPSTSTQTARARHRRLSFALRRVIVWYRQLELSVAEMLEHTYNL